MEKSSSEMEEKMNRKELQYKEGSFEGYRKKSRASGTREETEPLAARFTRNRELARTLKPMLLERGSKCKKSRFSGPARGGIFNNYSSSTNGLCVSSP